MDLPDGAVAGRFVVRASADQRAIAPYPRPVPVANLAIFLVLAAPLGSAAPARPSRPTPAEGGAERPASNIGP
jgi:hypothetical protein